MLIDTMKPVDQRGITLMMAFNSSTCSIVQRLHAFEADPSEAMSCSLSLTMQALFRNLKHKLINYHLKLIILNFMKLQISLGKRLHSTSVYQLELQGLSPSYGDTFQLNP